MHFDQRPDNTDSFLKQLFADPAFLEQLRRLAHARAGCQAGRADASGLVIEALLKAGQHWREVQDPCKLTSWVKTILVREIMAKLKLAHHQRTREFGDSGLDFLKDTKAQDDAVERDEDRIAARARLWRLLSRLSEADREILCLSRIQEIPDPDVAVLLNVTEETVRKRRSRALERLKKLAEQFPDG
jgi:RNA polymerase sigma-70 factor (ECF subfamily)